MLMSQALGHSEHSVRTDVLRYEDFISLQVFSFSASHPSYYSKLVHLLSVKCAATTNQRLVFLHSSGRKSQKASLFPIPAYLRMTH